MNEVDVVVPIYDGLEETQACIESALATLNRQWARLLLIDDCSPNPELKAYLREIAQANPDVVLLENAENKGFVATANRGMSYDNARDVLLLNSDVEVYGDWLARMRAAAYVDSDIGSVTPFSNNATICSFPNFCEDNTLLFGMEYPEIAEHFERIFTPEDSVDVPTGVGFCMYIRRDCLEQVGDFDEELFGRGYGEENHWCQRAIAEGWRNIHTAACFIYHKGGVSFGASQKPAIARAMETLDRCYPQYHRDIQDFIAEDPARKLRQRALLEVFAKTERPKIALVNHNLGGGAQQHVDELATMHSDNALFLQIRPVVEGRTVRLTVCSEGKALNDAMYFHVNAYYPLLVNFLRQLGVGRFHFHHTMGLHPRLWSVPLGLECPFDVTVHDYYFINGNPTLTDGDADYVDESSPDFDARCEEHYPLPKGVDSEQWREFQRFLVEGAERVIFPSEDCHQRLAKFFDIPRALVAYHPDGPAEGVYPDGHWRYDGGRPLRVLTLGALSREKGSEILNEVAKGCAWDDIEFHLLGYAHRALSREVKTHGPYNNDDVEELVAAIDPDVIWLPARWPETYSYTLSIAMTMGLPVVVPDIGAFPERIAGRANSIARPWHWTAPQWRDFWRDVLKQQQLPDPSADPKLEPSAEASANSSVSSQRLGFYDEAYLAPVPALSGEIDDELFDALEDHFSQAVPPLALRERILVSLWRLSQSPWMAGPVDMVPFKMRRAIKRSFSPRPMHELLRDF